MVTGPTSNASATAIHRIFLMLMFAPFPPKRYSARTRGLPRAGPLSRNLRSIGDRIGFAGLGECPQTKSATIAHAERRVLGLITRPGEAERRAQLDSSPHDFAFAHRDHRGHDFDVRLGARAHARQFLEHTIIFRPAI